MINFRHFLPVFCTLALLPAPGSTDEGSVRSAVMDHYRAFAARDHEALGGSIFAPDYSIFSSSGGLLREGFDQDRMKAGFKAGLTFAFEPRHIEVQLLDDTAVVTGYLDARISRKKQGQPHEHLPPLQRVGPAGRWVAPRPRAPFQAGPAFGTSTCPAATNGDSEG